MFCPARGPVAHLLPISTTTPACREPRWPCDELRIPGRHLHVPVTSKVSDCRRSRAGLEDARHEVVPQAVELVGLLLELRQEPPHRMRERGLTQTRPSEFGARGSLGRCGFFAASVSSAGRSRPSVSRRAYRAREINVAPSDASDFTTASLVCFACYSKQTWGTNARFPPPRGRIEPGLRQVEREVDRDMLASAKRRAG